MWSVKCGVGVWNVKRKVECKVWSGIAPPVSREKLDEANDKPLRCIVTDINLSYK